jgi:hypothetical protein
MFLIIKYINQKTEPVINTFSVFFSSLCSCSSLTTLSFFVCLLRLFDCSPAVRHLSELVDCFVKRSIQVRKLIHSCSIALKRNNRINASLNSFLLSGCCIDTMLHLIKPLHQNHKRLTEFSFRPCHFQNLLSLIQNFDTRFE